MSVMARLRRFWLDVHLWIGAGLSIPIILLCFSGAVLTFHDELDRLVHPARYAISGEAQLAPSAYVAAARDALGEGFVISGLRLPRAADDPVIAQARAKGRPQPGQRPASRSVYLDPPTARALSVADTRADAFGVLHQIHGSLMIPDIGRKVVGWIGWAMLVSSLTGIWLWWPRNGNLLAALRWRRGPRTTFNLHHLLGFWIAIPLAILSATGVYISFPQTARSLAQHLVPMSAAPPQQGPPGGGGPPLAHPHLSIDEAAAAARAAAPHSRLTGITFPARGRDGAGAVWRAELRAGGPAIQVIVDDATGVGVLRDALSARLPGDDLALTMRRIHDGVDQNILWRIVVFLGGAIPLGLTVTGIIMWLRRRAARRAVRRGAATHSS